MKSKCKSCRGLGKRLSYGIECSKCNGTGHYDNVLERKAKEIMNKYPDIIKRPASLSGKYHHGETVRDHIKKVVSIMRHLCDACNIHGEQRDILIASAYLHDIGNERITRKGKVEEKGWKYFPQTDYSKYSRRRAGRA